MALRLAGEEFSVVRGLDALGWPREITVNDADPGLKVTQSGSGPGVKVVSGDVDLNNNQLKNAKLGSTLNANGQDVASLGKLKFTDILLKEDAYDMLGVRNAADSAYRGLVVGDTGLWIYSGRLEFVANAMYMGAPSTDDYYLAFKAQDNGVGIAEVARLQGAADPYFQATLPVVLKPSSAPGTPVEGHFWYDATAKKLKFYNGTGVESVTSA